MTGLSFSVSVSESTRGCFLGGPGGPWDISTGLVYTKGGRNNGRQNLHIVDGVQTKMGGNAFRDHLHQFVVDRFWRLSLDEIEVAIFFIFGLFRQQPMVDSVGIDDYPRAGGLTENLCKADAGNHLGGDDIGQNSPRL